MRIRLAGFVLAAALLAYACADSSTRVTTGASSTSGAGLAGPSVSSSGPGNGSGGGAPLDRNAVLAAVGENVILATYRDFVLAAEALDQAAGVYAGSLGQDDHEELRSAWLDAMAVWQRAELMQVGPAAIVSRDIVGGQGLRDEIYSWPTVNRCRVDQELCEGAYANVEAFKLELINVRGLDALEYLLWDEDSVNACAPQNEINMNGSWNGIVAELPQRRADYAKTLSSILVDHATQLRDTWEPSGGNFLGQFSLSSSGGIFGSSQEAINALGVAMILYLDQDTKDSKLAVPAGLMDCASATCPNMLESTLAGASKQHIRENLVGFQLLLLGGAPESDALGVDDLLAGVGAGDLAASMGADTAAAIAAVDAIEEEDLADALADDLASVHALHAAVKKISDQLKTQFVSVLAIELPPGEGDND